MSFEDLVGQEHVSRTLGNAIASGRVAHAFLFTGVRGVGKTTAARILAKALNCLGPPEEPRTGPTATPCLQCAACREIAAGTDVDVREIDGASYTGVDDVRKLQDSIPYRPTRDRYKIFIVDEVHMLSQNAWNAFLKTLEEPPPHVKFIFATTEVHKVPVTILSRVQRFDFKLIPTRLIAERLRYVLSEEGIRSDDQAVSLIAREAAGSMRDAMSLLDQVIAWSDTELTGDAVARVLGVASHTVLYDVVRGMVEGDPARCLALVQDLANQGFDISTVARDLLALLRDLVVAKVCSDPDPLLDLPDEEKRDVKELAAKSDADDLLRLHQGFSQSFDDVVRSGQPRAGLEMLLVRLARRPPLLPIDDLLQRLGALERRLSGAAPRSPSGAGGAGPPSGDPRPPQGRGPGAGAPPTRRASAEPPPGVTPSFTSSAPAREAPATESLGATAPSTRNGAPREAANGAAATRPSQVPASASQPAAAGAPPSLRPADPIANPRPAGTNGHAAASQVPRVPPAPARDGAADMGAWSAIVERVREERPELAAYLHHAAPIQITRDKLVLGYEPGSLVERGIRAADAQSLIAACSEACLGARPEIVLQPMSPGGAENTLSRTAERERRERRRESVARAEAHPMIAELSEILGARLKEIQLPEE